MTIFAARLPYLLAAALGRLPWAVPNGIGDLAALWKRWLDARASRVSRHNLELAFPALSDHPRVKLRHATLRASARQWIYRRHSLRLPDSGETNPYRDLERH